LQRAQRGAPRSIGPTRLRAPQLAHVMIDGILEAYDCAGNYGGGRR
jgi:hypothetical protein